MFTRHRTRVAALLGSGSAEDYISGSLAQRTVVNRNSLDYDCWDVHNAPGVDHDFLLTKKDVVDMVPFNGHVASGPFAGSGFTNFHADWLTRYAGPVNINRDTVDAQDFAILRSRTNPSRPTVAPLTLIQDLVDIPKQLRDVRKLFSSPKSALNAKELANHNLSVQFGWLPLIDDAKHIIKLQHYIAKRKEELVRLDGKSGLKRRIRLSESTDHDEFSNQSVAATNWGGTGYVNVSRQQTTVKYGTVRWKPTNLPNYDLTDVERTYQLVRSVVGFSPEGDIQGLWDIIPWTWVTDWFVDIGSYMTQYSNTIPAEATHCNVMRNVKVVANISKSPLTSSWVDGGYGSVSYEIKSRAANTAPFAVRIPFIGLQRLSILGSLFIQRFK